MDLQSGLCVLRGRSAHLAGVLGLIVLSFSATPVSAQVGAVAGRITDAATGRPMSGVSLVLVGTTQGGVTGQEGEYRVANVPVGEIEIRASMLGYAPVSRFVVVIATGTVVADIALVLTPVSLDALVITATGLQRRRELGNAATTLQVGRELERTAPTTLTSLLQGKAAGVQVLQSSGTTGAASMLKEEHADDVSKPMLNVVPRSITFAHLGYIGG
jgi:hypothetical protein